MRTTITCAQQIDLSVTPITTASIAVFVVLFCLVMIRQHTPVLLTRFTRPSGQLKLLSPLRFGWHFLPIEDNQLRECDFIYDY